MKKSEHGPLQLNLCVFRFQVLLLLLFCFFVFNSVGLHMNT